LDAPGVRVANLRQRRVPRKTFLPVKNGVEILLNKLPVHRFKCENIVHHRYGICHVAMATFFERCEKNCELVTHYFLLEKWQSSVSGNH